MSIIVLTLNLFMYNMNLDNSLLKKLNEIIDKYNINILFFQEDIETIMENQTKILLERKNFRLVSYCKSEKYTKNEKEIQIINSIYIRNDIADNSDVETNDGKMDENCIGYIDKNLKKYESARCYASAKIKIGNKDIILVTTHLCGGKFADMYYEESSDEKNIEIEKIFTELKNKYGDIPSIFAADFNSIHKSRFLNENIPHYMKVNDDTKKNITKYLTSGHKILEHNGLQVVIPDGYTTPFKSIVDYTYYDPKKFKYIDSQIVNTLDVTDHNGVVTILLPNVINYDKHHEKYKNDYLYNKTISAFRDNMPILKKYAPDFIEYKDDIEYNIKTIYNKIYYNIINTDLKGILDKIFDKKKVPKDTYVFNTFEPRPKSSIHDFLKDSKFDLEYAFDIIYKHHKYLSNEKDFNKSYFSDIVRPFTKLRNKGGMYTTSCFESNEKSNINNLILSLSTRFYNKTQDDKKVVSIFKTNDDYELYNLYPDNFKGRILFKRIISNILFQGKFNSNMTLKELDDMYDEKIHGTINALVVHYPFDCRELIKEDIYVKKDKSCVSVYKNNDCISGYWDGENTLHEYILNHFVGIYNNENLPENRIIGCIDRDSGYDGVLKKNIFIRELVWFNNEQVLDPVGFYFNNRIVYNIYEYYKGLTDVLYEKSINTFIPEKQNEISYEDMKKLSDDLCLHIFKSKNIFYDDKFDENNNIRDVKTFIDYVNNLNIVKFSKDVKLDLYGGNTYRDKYIKYKTKYLKLKKN